MTEFIKLIKIYNWFGVVVSAGIILLFLVVEGNPFLCVKHDCSGSLTYFFLSFMAVPYGIFGAIVSGIAVWKKQLSWIWVLLNLIVGGIFPLLIWLGALIYLD